MVWPSSTALAPYSTAAASMTAYLACRAAASGPGYGPASPRAVTSACALAHDRLRPVPLGGPGPDVRPAVADSGGLGHRAPGRPRRRPGSRRRARGAARGHLGLQPGSAGVAAEVAATLRKPGSLEG